MIVNAKEERLVADFRKLPAESADQLSALIARMAAVQPGVRLDWSDEWSDQDLRDFTSASSKRVDAGEREPGR